MVLAGETTYFVSVVQDVLIRPEPAPVKTTELTPQQRLLRLLRNDFQPLYAVLDCSAEPSVLKVLVESGVQRQSLFEGTSGAMLTHFAPHLARLTPDSLLLKPLVKQGWGKSWGIFATCELGFEEMRDHFRQFLIVQIEDGGKAYFRFYDPRVMRQFLPTCLPDQVNFLFGPVKYLLMEDEKPDVLLRFSNAGRGVGRKGLPLDKAKLAEPASPAKTV
jgi:hypothetical protein